MTRRRTQGPDFSLTSGSVQNHENPRLSLAKNSQARTKNTTEIHELEATPDSTAHVLSPVVRLLEAEHFADLAVRQGRLELAHRPGDRRIGTEPGQRLYGRLTEGDRIVGRVKHLKAESVLLQA